MTDLGLRAPSAEHVAGANWPRHPSSTPPSLEEQLQAWEPEILRAARARGVSQDATEDLAQAARIRLAKAIARNPTVTERYLRRVIVNAMHDEFRAKRVIDDPVLINREDEDEEEGLGEPEAVDEMPLASESFFDAQYVREWASALSIREQCIADLLWVRGASERDAAAELGISKTRLHQLKDDLARRARIDLVALAA